MDDIVKAALLKWPHVPHCYHWLGLDARGHWHVRDQAAQAAGAFASSLPGSKGSVLRHEKLIDFIQRNYQADNLGRWYFQNGPQRVYVELEATPYIWRVASDFSVAAHTGAATHAKACLLDEIGRVYLLCELGFGLVHTQDVWYAAQAIEDGMWGETQQTSTQELPLRFGFVRSPQPD